MQGKTINGFILQRLLGRGGMAEVWYAENEIGKPAAVKILNEDLSHNVQIVERFRNEAVVMVKLGHKNIRQVYDYDTIDGRAAIIMEYLDGDDLKARMKKGQRFSDEQLRKWWNQLVDALNYTHRQGIVHRDIKPGNIFVDNNDDIKLLDFGIAKVRESISTTQTGQKLGTLMYMSPEQVKDSKHIDYHTDIYSLAVTFVHLLTGKKPYDSETSSDFEISEQIVYKPLDLSGLPDAWRVFLTPYLNKQPDQRPALRHFVEAASAEYFSPSTQTDESTMVGQERHHAMPDDEGTFAVGSPQLDPKPASNPQSQKDKAEPQQSNGKPKKKMFLWIGIGLVAAAAVLLVLLLKPKEEEPEANDPDTEAYRACQTVDDYRDYIEEYGSKGRHYKKAKQFVERYDDSVVREQQAIAEMERIQREEEERQYKQVLRTIRDEYIRLLSANTITGSDYDEGYFLYDIDNNGIPELWIKNGTCEADYVLHVYTYKDGIKKIGELWAGHIGGYYKGNGYLLRSGGQMGYYFYEKLAYNGTSITETTVYEEEYDFEKEVSVPTKGDKRYVDEAKIEITFYSLSNKQPILNTFYVD